MDDTISRQAAIDVLSFEKEMLNRVLNDMDVVGAEREKYSWGLGLIESNIKDIEELPPAERRGRWTEKGMCSICGQEAVYEQSDYGGDLLLTPFCPWCGARMETSE